MLFIMMFIVKAGSKAYFYAHTAKRSFSMYGATGAELIVH